MSLDRPNLAIALYLCQRGMFHWVLFDALTISVHETLHWRRVCSCLVFLRQFFLFQPLSVSN